MQEQGYEWQHGQRCLTVPYLAETSRHCEDQNTIGTRPKSAPATMDSLEGNETFRGQQRKESSPKLLSISLTRPYKPEFRRCSPRLAIVILATTRVPSSASMRKNQAGYQKPQGGFVKLAHARVLTSSIRPLEICNRQDPLLSDGPTFNLLDVLVRARRLSHVSRSLRRLLIEYLDLKLSC